MWAIILLLVTIILLLTFFKKKEYFTQNKCAFCIPLHPKHFNYGYEIVEALKGTDADLYFIFTDNSEKESFEQKGDFNYLILSDFVDVKRLDKNRSWVSVKKLYALSKLYKKYEYISCIDSEVIFINQGFYKAMKAVANNKIICGGDISDSVNKLYPEIMKQSLTNIIPSIDRSKLKSISHNYTIYTWWSNLPVYDCSKASEFLNWIKFNNTDFIDKVTWYVFDDMVYNYFLLLRYNYELHIVPGINTSLEYASNDIIQKVDSECKLYWVTYSEYKKDTAYYKKNSFIIVYHVDR